MTLKDLPIGKTATIRSVGGEGALRQHFLDMGLIPHGDVTMVKFAPMGDPMELRIHSYELTLRLADAEKIEIENVRDAVPLTPPERRAPEEIRPVSAGARQLCHLRQKRSGQALSISVCGIGKRQRRDPCLLFSVSRAAYRRLLSSGLCAAVYFDPV